LASVGDISDEQSAAWAISFHGLILEEVYSLEFTMESFFCDLDHFFKGEGVHPL